MNNHTEIIEALKRTITSGEDRLTREEDDNSPIKSCYKAALLFMTTYPQDMMSPTLMDEYDGSISLFWSHNNFYAIIRFSSDELVFAYYVNMDESVKEESNLHYGNHISVNTWLQDDFYTLLVTGLSENKE